MRDQLGFSLAVGLELSGLELSELWVRYSALGGRADSARLAEQVRGSVPCAASEHDLIAQALNEAFLDRGMDAFPVGYSGRRERLPVPVLAGATADSRVADARRRAVLARERSARAARQAAALHLTASRLMRVSGQLQFADRARRRATQAHTRGAAARP